MQAMTLQNLLRICLLCFSLLSGFSASAAPDFPQRILFIGNSYYYYNNSLHNHVRGFVEAGSAGQDRKLQYKSATIGGATLDHHPIEWLTEPGRIGVKDAFEIVVLAGNSADALRESSRQKFVETVRRFDPVIRARGGRTALYMTPAYAPPHRQVAADNLTKIADMYSSVAREVGAVLIPVGLAFEASYQRRPDLRLHDEYDGSHPSLAGTYLAAAVVYAALYGANPVGNAYRYHGKIAPEVAQHLQEVAQQVVQHSSTRSASN